MRTRSRGIPGLVAVALVAVVVVACASGRGDYQTPYRTVEGSEYFTVERTAQKTGEPIFTRKLAWLGAASALSRAVATEVYARLTRTDSLRLEALLKGAPGEARDEIQGAVDFIDEATSRVPLRDIHELRYREKEDRVRLTLGIPTPTFREIVDAKLEVMERHLEEEVVDLEARRQR